MHEARDAVRRERLGGTDGAAAGVGGEPAAARKAAAFGVGGRKVDVPFVSGRKAADFGVSGKSRMSPFLPERNLPCGML